MFDPNVLFNRENGVYYGREEHDIITSNGARWASFGDKPSRESTQLPKNFVFCKGFNFCVDVDTDPLGYARPSLNTTALCHDYHHADTPALTYNLHHP